MFSGDALGQFWKKKTAEEQTILEEDLLVEKQQSTWHTAILGLQHLLAMYSGDILVPLLVGSALKFRRGECPSQKFWFAY